MLRFLRHRCLLTFALACAALAALPLGAAHAERPDGMIPVKGVVQTSVEIPGDVTTLGFLLTDSSASKLTLLIKPAKKSPLELDVRLIAPDETNFDPSQVGSLKATSKLYKAKFVGVPQAGLWRIEIRGANDSVGGCSVKLSVVEKQKLSDEEVVPANFFTDIPVKVGEDQELSVKVKRGSGTQISPNLELFDPNGSPLDLGGFLKRNTRAGSVQLKKFRLPVFGTYVLRIRGEVGQGGAVKYTVKSKLAKLKGVLPIADPGESFEGEPSASVRLDASASSGGGGRRFVWTQVQGSVVELSDPQSTFPTFVAPSASETLVFQLSLEDLGVLSHAVPVVVNVGLRPLAAAGQSQRVTPNSRVQLDGSRSLDRSPRGLRFRWSQDPSDAQQVTLDDIASPTPSFDAPNVEGVLHFDLICDDGDVRSFADRVVVAVSAVERSVADAGRDQYVGRMASVHLSALASLRPGSVLDGGLMWTQTGGATVQLDDPGGVAPAFTAPKFSDELTFTLTIDGDTTTRDSVRVLVRASETNLPPTITAVRPLPTSGGSVVLNSTSGDGSNNPRTVRWGQVFGPTAPIDDPNAEDTTANIPAGSALYGFGMQANDGLQYSPLDLIDVSNLSFNSGPIARAGSDRVHGASQTVFVDGRSSIRTDGGVDPLTFNWMQVSGRDWYDVAAKDPTFNATAALTSFVIPSALSSLTRTRTISFALTVNDGATTSNRDVVTYTFAGLPLNGVPAVTASASDINPIAGGTVQLTATVLELDGDPLTHLWTRVSGPGVTFSPNARVLNPSIVAPTAGTVQLRFVSSDPFDSSTPANLTITVDQAPTAVVSITPPVADAGTTITVDGRSSSDPENANVTYSWTQTEGPTVNFASNAAVFTFTAPDAVVKFQLIVSDGRQGSLPATGMFASALPPSTAPTVSLATAPYGATVTLRAVPPANTNFSFTWRQINASGSDPVVTLSATNVENPSFSVPSPSTSPFGGSNFGQSNESLPSATFGVVASDGQTSSVEQTITVKFYASLSDPNGVTNTSVAQIIGSNCTSCHSGTNSSSNCGFGNNATFYGMANKAAILSNSVNTNNSCSSGSRAVPGSPGTSSLSTRINGQGGSMPPGGLMQIVDRNIVSDWISQGCSDN